MTTPDDDYGLDEAEEPDPLVFEEPEDTDLGSYRGVEIYESPNGMHYCGLNTNLELESVDDVKDWIDTFLEEE